MIGKFFPFPVFTVAAAPVTTPVRVKSTDAATEIANHRYWHDR